MRRLLHTMFPATIPVVFGQAMGGGMSTNLLFFGALFAIMYFVLIRPQQKQMKEQQSMLASLKKGDDVVTQGGMLGNIFSVADKVVTLEVASGVKLRVLKSSIQAKVTVTDEPAKAESDAKKEEK
jgi:preprotein translocase subunit YajC